MKVCVLEVSRGLDVGRIVSAIHPAAHSSSCSPSHLRTANRMTKAKPTTPIVAKAREAGSGAKTRPGAAARLLSTETTIVSHT